MMRTKALIMVTTSKMRIKPPSVYAAIRNAARADALARISGLDENVMFLGFVAGCGPEGRPPVNRGWSVGLAIGGSLAVWGPGLVPPLCIYRMLNRVSTELRRSTM
jgi:hypothetical protein